MVVYTDHDHVTIRVNRDQSWINTTLTSLEEIYFRRLIPIISNMAYARPGGQNVVSESDATAIKEAMETGKLCTCD